MRRPLRCSHPSVDWARVKPRARSTTSAQAASVIALVAVGLTFIPRALRTIWYGRLGAGMLMTISAIGAVLLGALGEAATLASLFSVSDALEGWAVSHFRRSLSAPARAGSRPRHDQNGGRH